ncbi:unnamed protein product [Orchesella dallaii]|uniref:Uncharacterized protein n=1 Tax=Orchesella dallaii TaxID=48710 RepID=A0ABP1PWD9_9HEXA
MSFLSIFFCTIGFALALSYDPDLNPDIGSSSTSTRMDSSAELVLGTFVHELPYSWFYETYYPIIIKIPMPDWSSNDPTISPHCEKDELTSKSSPVCPVSYHLNHLFNPVTKNIHYFKHINSADDEEDKLLFDSNLHCDRIRPHFNHFTTTREGLNSYYKKLMKRCPLAKELEEKELKLTFADMGHDIIQSGYVRLTEMLEKERKEALYKNGSSSNEWKFIQMSAYTSYQNDLALTIYSDTMRYENAFIACQSQRLDIKLVNPNMLADFLDEAKENLRLTGYNISIPYDELMTHYYKLPLTDCVLTSEEESGKNASLIIRLAVPVAKYGMAYKLVKLNKVPFLIRSSESEDPKFIGSICDIKNYQADDTFLVERNMESGLVTGMMKAPPTCAPYHVCRIPNVGRIGNVNGCVEGILQDDEEAKKRLCRFQCTPIPREFSHLLEFPLVTQLAANRYSITGAMLNETNDEEIVVTCFGKTRLATVKQGMKDEATIIALPCPCEIAIGTSGKRRYFAQKPCNNTLEIIHVTHVVGEMEEDDYNEKWHAHADQDNFLATGMRRRKRRTLASNVKKESFNNQEFTITEKNGSVKLSEEEETGMSVMPWGQTVPLPEEDEKVLNFCTGSHTIIWTIGCSILISNLFCLFALWKNGLLTWQGILAVRH